MFSLEVFCIYILNHFDGWDEIGEIGCAGTLASAGTAHITVGFALVQIRCTASLALLLASLAIEGQEVLSMEARLLEHED